jgi:hypothetical protein
VTSCHRNSAQGYKKVFSPHPSLPPLHLHLCSPRLEPIHPFKNTSSVSFVFGSSLVLSTWRAPHGSVPTFPPIVVSIRPRPERIRLRQGLIRPRLESVRDIVHVLSSPCTIDSENPPRQRPYIGFPTSFSVIGLRAFFLFVFFCSVCAPLSISSFSDRSAGVLLFRLFLFSLRAFIFLIFFCLVCRRSSFSVFLKLP